MPNFFIRGSKGWNILNSWWILLTFFPFGIASFIAFLYVGSKVRNQWWKIFGYIYLSLTFLFFNVPLTDMWLAVFLALWIISIVHAFRIRPVYLNCRKRSNANSKIKLKKKEDKGFYLHRRDGSSPLHKKKKNIKEIFEIATLTGTERKARDEIRKQITANSNSLKLVKKGFDSTGSFEHPILISFKEKVLLELRTQSDFNQLEDIEIDNYIEDEVISYLRSKGKLKNRTTLSVLKGSQSGTFIRRFPSVFLIVVTLISIHVLAYLYGSGPLTADTALHFGAVKPGEDSPDQWFRLASYIFIQTGGTLHLLVYAAAVLILAPPIERIYGSVKFPLMFLITGIVGGYFILTSSVDSVSGSAAGSILGLAGLHTGLLLKRNRIVHSEKKSLIWIAWIGIMLFALIESNLPTSVYLGGFFSGLLLSFLVTPQSFKRLSKTDWHFAIFQTVIVATLVFLSLGLPRYAPDVLNSLETISINEGNNMAKPISVNEANANTEPIKQVKTVTENSTGDKDGKEEKAAEENSDQYNYDQAIAYLNEGKPDSAIEQLKKVSKNSELYTKSQNQIKDIERNLYLESAKEISYEELQKTPDKFKGNIIHFYGRIYNIQEISGKTILSLSTTQSNEEITFGNEALILFPKSIPLYEGDYIHIYGKMSGNYSANYQKINNYLNGAQHTIYFDQRTFIQQVPVVETKIIVDMNGNMYEK